MRKPEPIARATPTLDSRHKMFPIGTILNTHGLYFDGTLFEEMADADGAVEDDMMVVALNDEGQSPQR